MANTAPAPAFDPNKPFTKVGAPAAPAPAFDPSKPFTKSSVPNAAQGAAVPASPPAAAPAPTMADEQRAAVASARAYKPTFDDFMKGAEAWARGASFGISDDASAGLAAAILKAKGDPRAMGEIYKQLDTAENARIDDYEKKNGSGAEVLGMFTGPGLARIGQFIGRGANWLARGGRAALAGAGTGAVTDVGYADPDKKLDPKRTATAAGIGAAVGPLVQGATEVVAPALSAAAQRVIGAGGRPRVGQLMGGAAKTTEEKIAGTVPLLGDVMNSQQRASITQFNRAAYNQVLAPLNARVAADAAVGHEGFAAIDDYISSQYDRVLPHVTLNPINDNAFLAEFSPIEQEINLLPRDQQQMVRDTINHYFVNRLREEPMSGTEFKRAESIISQRARNITKNPNSSMWDHEVASIYRDTLAALRNSLERTNPEYAGQLQPINQAYANLVRVQNATGRIGAKEGVFTPAQLLSAIKQTSSGKQFARGDALLQNFAQDWDSVIGNKYPDSGTAGRMLMSGGVGAALGAGAHLEPHTAATLAATTIPYLPGVRNWFSSPMSQSAGALLRQINPALAGQAPRALRHDGGIGQRYIGPTMDVPRVTLP